MKLTATVKLEPTDRQRRLLFETLEKAALACNAISEEAWDKQEFGRVPVHRLTYDLVRKEYGLASQIAVRCIGKVVEAYKKDQLQKHQFEPLGAVSYDSRVLTWRASKDRVSIWLAGGRRSISFETGVDQHRLLQYQQGESELVHYAGEFYIYTSCDVPDSVPVNPEGWLHVDLGLEPDWDHGFLWSSQ